VLSNLIRRHCVHHLCLGFEFFSGDYRAAFLACRKHRVDLNVLVELDLAAFVGSIASFVEQLDDVDHINLFLSGLRSFSPSSEYEVVGGSMVLAL
jgi:IKI3 family